MQRFFDDKNSEKLKKELDSWLGTPYRHYCGVKNKGTDCIHFIIRIIEKLGANQGRNLIIKQYPKDWNLHRGEELLKEEMSKQLYIETIAERDKDNILKFSEKVHNGDIILFKFGRLSGHCGMFFENQVYQSLNGRRVEKISFYNKDFYRRITEIYKIFRV